MYFTWCLFVNFILISSVVGIVIVENEDTSTQSCKEVSLKRTNRDSPVYFTQTDATHSSLVLNDTNHVYYFEMNLAIKADRSVRIQLMNKANHSASDVIYNIWIGYVVTSDQYTDLDQWSLTDVSTNIQHIQTPCILTAAKFREFYLKIDHGKLLFGVAGSTPLITHEDEKFSLINYFQFRYGWDNNAKIRYDCPLTC